MALCTCREYEVHTFLWVGRLSSVCVCVCVLPSLFPLLCAVNGPSAVSRCQLASPLQQCLRLRHPTAWSLGPARSTTCGCAIQTVASSRTRSRGTGWCVAAPTHLSFGCKSFHPYKNKWCPAFETQPHPLRREAVWTLSWSLGCEFQLVSGDAGGQVRLWRMSATLVVVLVATFTGLTEGFLLQNDQASQPPS